LDANYGDDPAALVVAIVVVICRSLHHAGCCWISHWQRISFEERRRDEECDSRSWVVIGLLLLLETSRQYFYNKSKHQQKDQ
jgi:hypothetical protein